VVEVMKLRKNVLHEAHRLKGLVRLQELENNLWYASIHPDNNVIENIGQFLIKRFPTQNLILHDKNRNLVFLYKACSNKNYEIVPVPATVSLPNFSAQEKQFQVLWKTFFHTIAIKERTNSRLQMQYMPQKYWQDLVEKK
jgi:probable DNA metabolism protein